MEDSEIPEKDIITAIEHKLETSEFKIVNYTVEPVEEKIGLLGDHAYLKVTILENCSNDAMNLSFFVKQFPKLESMATFARGAGAFQREEFIYEMFQKFKKEEISIIAKCTGSCYVAIPNKYLIFDNLDEEGFKMSKEEYLDTESLLAVLHSLAQLHASSLIYEEKKTEELGTEYRIQDGNDENLKETIYCDNDEFLNKDCTNAGLKCILTEISVFNFPEVLKSGRLFSDVVKEIYPKIYDLVKPSKNIRNVLCHGDMWSTNIMLRNNENGTISCKIVDFQSARYIPPAHDVLSVIYLTTSRNFRDKYMYQYIGMYYSFLEKNLKVAGYNLTKIIPFGDFMQSCEEQREFAVLFTATILPLILCDRNKLERYFCDKELYDKVLRGDRSYLVYENENNERYIERLRDSIQDLKEFCEKLR